MNNRRRRNRPAYELDPIPLLIMTVRQAFQQMSFWVRASLWRLLFSLPIVTAPAATGAFYAVIHAELHNRDGRSVNLRGDFGAAFRRHFWRSTALAVGNLLALAVIVQSAFFWYAQRDGPLIYLSVISAYCLLFWWACQPFLWPLLIEQPALSAWQVGKRTLWIVVGNPAYAFVLALAGLTLSLLTVALLGPVWLVVAPWRAIILIQGLWVVLRQPLPALIAAGAPAEEV